MSENKNLMQTIASLRRLYNELRRDYNELVLPWGAGYDMPEDASNKATTIMEHANRILQSIEELEAQIGIESKRNIPAPNARFVGKAEVYWRTAPFTELLESVACRMCWNYDQINDYILDMVDEWLDQYAPGMGDLAKQEPFWLFICTRLQVPLARIMAAVDDETSEPGFRREVRQGMRAYLFTANTYQAFGYKFLTNEE